MPRYRKKPIVIEAVQVAEHYSNFEEVNKFCGGRLDRTPPKDYTDYVEFRDGDKACPIRPTDYLVLLDNGIIIPMNATDFEKTYERLW